MRKPEKQCKDCKKLKVDYVSDQYMAWTCAEFPAMRNVWPLGECVKTTAKQTPLFEVVEGGE